MPVNLWVAIAPIPVAFGLVRFAWPFLRSTDMAPETAVVVMRVPLAMSFTVVAPAERALRTATVPVAFWRGGFFLGFIPMVLFFLLYAELIMFFFGKCL